MESVLGANEKQDAVNVSNTALNGTSHDEIASRTEKNDTGVAEKHEEKNGIVASGSEDNKSKENTHDEPVESNATPIKDTTPNLSDDINGTEAKAVESANSPSLKRKRSEDASTPTGAGAPIVSRDEMAKKEEDVGVLEFAVITNDGTPERMIQLMTLKNIFSKQLPKMPKEYIVRLVFDRNHHSMVILKNKKHVVGGICYRPFLANHFGEIAFCAITASEQVKGYGTRLMNHLKEYVKTQGITNFLTYADNYAIGYFKKQGFSKIVSMPKSNWFGYIKDYDGGTLMECCIHQHINYLDITSMVHQQRKLILEKIQAKSKAHIVYPGLTSFCEARLVDVYSVPGVREAGWSQTIIRNNRIGREPGSLKAQLQTLWKSLSNHRSAWPFHEPVDTTLVIDYLDIVKKPIDLSAIQKRIEDNVYPNKAAFKADLDLMCENCMLYNSSETNYYKAAKDLQEYINRKVEIDDAGYSRSKKR
ncbi:histone acetyltransferase [Thraustotheca clavata]|uniref:histone acetyltransferase n=1 Tax=Thraustotheca clavata TaxID=74557 RepID=A0A1V9ZPV9_9STRA|nr:histone acetyltransferase [Thraustotheca clavata]